MTEDTWRICAVLVSYHPDTDVLERALKALRPQVDELVVVDNGSSQEKLDWLHDRAKRLSFEVLPLGRNTGVATALNHGIGSAVQRGCGYVLLMDQDSIPEADMVARLVAAHRELEASGTKVAAVGPRYVDPISRHSSYFVRLGWFTFKRISCHPERPCERIPTDFLITSGSLVSLVTLDAVGVLDDEFFIDHVDTEWCLRARHLGYRTFGVCDAVMHHSLGSETVRVWLGRWRHVPVHSPLRHYYTFRNSLWLQRRPYAPLPWIVNNTIRLFLMFAFFSLFIPPRLQHLRMMLKGLREGIRAAPALEDRNRCHHVRGS
jgi:rhamnosyltransferase